MESKRIQKPSKPAGRAPAGNGVITCPLCGNRQKMPIPVGMCQAFYRCDICKKMIKAEKSCCVFCDYGDRPCPVGAHQ